MKFSSMSTCFGLASLGGFVATVVAFARLQSPPSWLAMASLILCALGVVGLVVGIIAALAEVMEDLRRTRSRMRGRWGG